MIAKNTYSTRPTASRSISSEHALLFLFGLLPSSIKWILPTYCRPEKVKYHSIPWDCKVSSKSDFKDEIDRTYNSLVGFCRSFLNTELASTPPNLNAPSTSSKLFEERPRLFITEQRLTFLPHRDSRYYKKNGSPKGM